jgi:transposase InsO family protein
LPTAASSTLYPHESDRPRHAADAGRGSVAEREPSHGGQGCPANTRSRDGRRCRGGSVAKHGFDSAEKTLSISQTIELGDKRLKRLQAAQLEASLAGWDLEAVEYATLEWVDRFNHRRLLEPIGHVPPAEAEAAYYAALEEPAALAA